MMRLLGACSLLTLGLVGAGLAHGQPVPGYAVPPYGGPPYGAPSNGMVPYGAGGYPSGYVPSPGYYGVPGYPPPGYFAAPPGYTPYGSTPVGITPGYPMNIPQPTSSGSLPAPGGPTTTLPVAPAVGEPGKKLETFPSTPPAGQDAPEGAPIVGGPYYDDSSAGEPMVQIVGPNKPGLVPQTRWTAPERPGLERFWFGAGYLASFIRSERFSAPLVTTGSPNDARPGALGQPNTVVLFGGNNESFDLVSGIRAEAGMFLGDHQICAVELAAMYYFPSYVRFSANSNAAGSPVIARPFFDAVSGTQRSFLDSFPGIATGSSGAELRNEMYGGEVNLRYRCGDPDSCFHIDLLGGFRYLRLEERLTVADTLQPLPGNPGGIRFQGALLTSADLLSDADFFQATNDFYGGQFGFRARWDWEKCYISGFTKFAFGATSETVDVNGTTSRTNAAGTTTVPGGILALPSNSGSHTRTVFSFVPEFGLEMGVRVTPHLRVTAGYSFLTWTGVVRPGNQLVSGINRAQVPSDSTFGAGGPPLPQFRFSSENFWMHTLSLGFNFTY
jgi:hypothetical protein